MYSLRPRCLRLRSRDVSGPNVGGVEGATTKACRNSAQTFLNHIIVNTGSLLDRVTGLCDQRLAAATSVVRSPGYPGGYGPNLRCRYTVLKLNRNVCRLQVLFKRFSLENSFGCRKDYLEMPDRTRICGRYAGSRECSIAPRLRTSERAGY
ncbi:hypothetical protein HPB48_003783 [Haemaphysalis longicornis]|uniref:CUB domain-containing protein n=1 Tax=Haemaphysalis longicornis TaxID=44386 RepID=A0A9J6FH87_HAELO|nr:hypothetical protein HPB48_003783 [Haemaphysalis longicornis]